MWKLDDNQGSGCICTLSPESVPVIEAFDFICSCVILLISQAVCESAKEAVDIERI
jgi:hypothetical protein